MPLPAPLSAERCAASVPDLASPFTSTPRALDDEPRSVAAAAGIASRADGPEATTPPPGSEPPFGGDEGRKRENRALSLRDFLASEPPPPPPRQPSPLNKERRTSAPQSLFGWGSGSLRRDTMHAAKDFWAGNAAAAPAQAEPPRKPSTSSGGGRATEHPVAQRSSGGAGIMAGITPSCSTGSVKQDFFRSLYVGPMEYGLRELDDGRAAPPEKGEQENGAAPQSGAPASIGGAAASSPAPPHGDGRDLAADAPKRSRRAFSLRRQSSLIEDPALEEEQDVGPGQDELYSVKDPEAEARRQGSEADSTAAAGPGAEPDSRRTGPAKNVLFRQRSKDLCPVLVVQYDVDP
ncbi:MAG: hypothetical protein BJ554DRAFT_4038, partial [Olpidium bornovanus]